MPAQSSLPGQYRASRVATWGVTLLVAILSQTGLLERSELLTQDGRFLLRGPHSAHTKIVVVAVGNDTVNTAWPEPMAFWGAHMADVIRQARQQGAKIVGVDFVLAASTDDVVSAQLAEALGQAQVPPTLARRLLDNLPPEMMPKKTFVRELQASLGRVVLADNRNVQSEDMRSWRDDLDVTRAQLGFANLSEASDGMVHAIPLYEKQESLVIPSFAALVAARVRGLDAQDEPTLRQLAGLTLTKAENAEFMLNDTGEVSTDAFPHLAAEQVATGQLSEKESALLKDAIVLVGATFDGAEDQYHSVTGLPRFGVDIQAQAIATLLEGRALQRWTRGQETLLTLGLGLVFAFLVLRLPFGRGLIIVGFGVAGWCLLAQIAFVAGDRLLFVTGPILALLLPFTACYLARSVEEEKRRRQVERAFGRTVSPAICDYLLADPARQRLGGEKQDGSVLFFDVRGSTALAACYPPERIFAELNALFAAIVPIIEERGGLLYRYTGDGFLAVFGAPVPLSEHRQAALRAAYEIVQRVQKHNAVRSRPDGRLWEVGCGVHSGELAYGNLGVAERAEFTVIGDTVNVAARLESLNKQVKSEIVVSAATIREDTPPAWLRGPVPMPVAGREVAGEVTEMQVYYALLGRGLESTGKE